VRILSGEALRFLLDRWSMHFPSRLLSILIGGLLVIDTGAVLSAQGEEPSDKIVSRIPREPVASSVLASVGYSKRRQILEIEFVNGAIYRYFGVPRSVYHHFMAAESKTRYYHQNIKGNFRSLRVRRWHTENSEH
jgi:hypothetical protein